MSIRTITPPRSQNLLTLEQAKLYMGASATESDALYSSLISAASSAMIQALGLSPLRQRYEERNYGTNGFRFYLSRLPAEPGTLSITLDGVALVEGSYGTMESSEFLLEDSAAGVLYRSDQWLSCPDTLGSLGLSVTYHAGFVPPDSISTWSTASVHTVGSFVRPTVIPSLLLYECTTAGTSGTPEPAWPTTIGGTITDGTCIWTARAAVELPPFVSSWCYMELLRLLGNRSWTPGRASFEIEGASESRFATHGQDQLSLPVLTGLKSWRTELGLVGVA